MLTIETAWFLWCACAKTKTARTSNRYNSRSAVLRATRGFERVATRSDRPIWDTPPYRYLKLIERASTERHLYNWRAGASRSLVWRSRPISRGARGRKLVRCRARHVSSVINDPSRSRAQTPPPKREKRVWYLTTEFLVVLSQHVRKTGNPIRLLDLLQSCDMKEN